MLARLVSCAEHWKLEIEPCGDDEHPAIWQVWIKNPRRSSLSTKLLVTCMRNTPSVTVCHALRASEKVSWRRAFTWLEIIAI